MPDPGSCSSEPDTSFTFLVHTHTRTHAHAHTHTHTHSHTRTRTHTHTHAHTHGTVIQLTGSLTSTLPPSTATGSIRTLRAHVHTFIPSLHRRTHTHARAYRDPHGNFSSTHTLTHTRTLTHAHTHSPPHTHTHAYRDPAGRVYIEVEQRDLDGPFHGDVLEHEDVGRGVPGVAGPLRVGRGRRQLSRPIRIHGAGDDVLYLCV